MSKKSVENVSVEIVSVEIASGENVSVENASVEIMHVNTHLHAIGLQEHYKKVCHICKGRKNVDV